jgi:transcriptional regulator with XRE-family HTH domain
MSSPSFGRRLAQLRRRRGLSQRQLADRLCLAAGVSTISRNEISRWERGVRLPAQPWLGWLSVVLDTPVPTPPAGASRIGQDPAVARRWQALCPRITARPAVPLVSRDGASD